MQTRHTKHQTIRQQYVQFKSEVNQLGVAKEQHVNQLLYGRIWSEKISTEVLHSLWHYEGRGGGGGGNGATVDKRVEQNCGLAK